MKLFNIGCHVSFVKENGLLGSAKLAKSYGSSFFQIFTGPPLSKNRSPINKENTNEAHLFMKENNMDIEKCVVHAPYTVNMANTSKPDLVKYSIDFINNEINRTNELGIKNIILHPGSKLQDTLENAINLLIDSLNKLISNNKTNVVILLETMSGKGNEIGRTFEELKTIIDGITEKNRIGVIIDTCHIWDAGYDVKNPNKVLDEFDKVIGLNYLKAIHLNDSKNEMGSRKDRHSIMEFGNIGVSALKEWLNNERIKDLPFILETPYVDGKPVFDIEIEKLTS